MASIDPEIFRSEFIEVPRELVAEYQYGLIGTGETIKIKVYRPVGADKPFYGHSSHNIKTPSQSDFYRPNEKPAKSIEDAVRYALGEIMGHYEAARSEGHAPSPDWLERNRYF